MQKDRKIAEQIYEVIRMDDLISRSAAMDAFASLVPYVIDDALTEAYEHGLSDGYAVICNLPSAQPERKTGKWLIRRGIADAQCSECKMYFKDVYDMDNSDAFCRHCGIKMEGLKMVEDE